MIFKTLKTFSNPFKCLIKFQFTSQCKIYQGLVFSQKLKYTAKDNIEYKKLCLQNDQKSEQIDSKKSQYVDRMLLSSIFSRIIGTNLTLSIYLSQKVEILADVPLDKYIEGRVSVAKDLGKGRYLLKTQVLGTNCKGEHMIFVSGQARIMFKQ